jgi:hypothetical protein
MNNLSQKAKNCLTLFITSGCVAVFIAFLVDGEIWKALLTVILFGVLVICAEKYLR